MLSWLKRSLPAGLKNPLRRWLWKQLGLNGRLRSGLEVSLQNHADWTIYHEIFANGEYDLPIRETLQQRPTGRHLLVLDLGANVGFFTLRFADLALQAGLRPGDFAIQLYEGSPAVFAELQQRIALQPDLYGSCKFFGGLVGQRYGHGFITESHRHFANAVQADSGASGPKVGYIDLEQACPPGTIDLLKCDIEGAELDFLQTYPALLRRTQRLVIELHGPRSKIEAALGLIRQHNFSREIALRDTADFSVFYFSR